MDKPRMTCPQCHADLRRHPHKMSCTEPDLTRQDVRKLVGAAPERSPALLPVNLLNEPDDAL